MKPTEPKKSFSPIQREELLVGLQARFEKNLQQHPALGLAKVKARLEANPEKLWSLGEMERSNVGFAVVGGRLAR
ncbi:MAG: DUF4256 domain-containing protein [Verrucomicrobia bacterium]|nr:DUF4256 domain-containing protein [Verrucomicrobiota bacterium]